MPWWREGGEVGKWGSEEGRQETEGKEKEGELARKRRKLLANSLKWTKDTKKRTRGIE